MPNLKHIVVQCLPNDTTVSLSVHTYHISGIGATRVIAQHEHSCPLEAECRYAMQPACEARKRDQ